MSKSVKSEEKCLVKVIQLTFKDDSTMLFNARNYHWTVGDNWLIIETDETRCEKRQIMFPREMLKKVVIQNAKI